MSRPAHLPEQWNRAGSKLLFSPTVESHPPVESRPAIGRPDLEALRGRLTEVSGGRPAASLTLAVRWVLEAQRRCETAVWLQSPGSMLHPPDLLDAGVDLDRLVVVRLASGDAIARAADFLLRTGAIGIAILDLLAPGARRAGRTAHAGAPSAVGTQQQTMRPRSHGWMNRLLALALAHRSAVVCLTATERAEPSLASLVGLRLEPRLLYRSDGGFTLETTVLKDKRAQPHRCYREVCRGPLGLR